MTTGAEIFAEFNTYMDEVGSGYIDPISGNNIFKKANINIVDRKVEEFQQTQKVTREMQPLITVTAPITIVSSAIDVSSTSTVVTDYYSFINLEITSPYRGRTLVNFAKEVKFDRRISFFSRGTATYPKYYFTNGQLNILPKDATSAVLTYFKNPIVINVEDSTTPINYNEKLVQLIIDEAMVIAGVKGRDQWITQQGALDESRNP